MTCTADQIIAKAQSTLGKYATRSGGKKYANTFTKYYKGRFGIDTTGHMPKEYGYVPGFCTLWVGWVFDHVEGGHDYIPFKALNKKKDRWWHTGDLMRWYQKNHPSWCVTSPSAAKKGALAFKGQIKNGKLTSSPTHTCIFIKAEGDYVWTVDGNVSDGKGHNAGAIHKRHKKYFLKFVNIPYSATPTPAPTPKPTPTKTTKYKVVTKGSNLNIRASASSKAKKVGSLKNGTIVEVDKTSGKWKHVVGKGWVYGTYLTKYN